MNTLPPKPEIHSIRLHGPWDAKVLDDFGDQEKVGQQRRLKIPSDWGDWLGVNFCGRVEYRRNFNRPTGLEPGQAVWLVVERVNFHGDVFLNDRPLGSLTYCESTLQPLRVEIREHLELSNVLRIEIHAVAEIHAAADSDRPDRVGQTGGLVGSVRIEIEQ